MPNTAQLFIIVRDRIPTLVTYHWDNFLFEVSFKEKEG